MKINKKSLLNLLNKDENDKTFQDFLSQLSSPDIYIDNDLKRKYYSFESDGIEFNIENNKINTIFLFVAKTDKYHSCKNICLETDFLFNFKKKEIINILGKPNLEREELIGMFGIKYQPMIRYDYVKYSLVFDFNNQFDVTLISIMCSATPQNPTKD